MYDVALKLQLSPEELERESLRLFLRHRLRLVEIEFAAIVVQTDRLGAKLRILLTDTSFVDVWVSRKLAGRFGFHWERRHQAVS